METIKHNNIKFYKIKDFPDYYISKCGKVLSTNYNRTNKYQILKTYKNRYNYIHIFLYKFKIRYSNQLHRLIAKTFISNINNKPCVNHINGIKHDNYYKNLEWCTKSENTLHAYRIGLMKNKKGENHHNSRKIKQLDLDGNLIKIWDCIKYACDELNIHNSNIIKVCNKKRKTTGNYKWEYL